MYIVDHNDITICVDFTRKTIINQVDFHGIQNMSYDEADIKSVKLDIGGREIELVSKLTEDQIKIISNLVCED